MGSCYSKTCPPTLLCLFEEGNKEQENYCLKLKDNFRHKKYINFEIKSSPNFSIELREKGKIHNIQSIYNKGELENSLNIIYKILDEEAK